MQALQAWKTGWQNKCVMLVAAIQSADWEMVQRMANKWQSHPQIATPVEALKVDLHLRGRDAYASNGYKLP